MEHQETKTNEKLRSRLQAAIKNQKVSHAYIFEGSANIDKKAFANDFVKALLCPEATGTGCGRCATCRKIDHENHQDIIYIEADGRSIKDQAIETLQTRLKVKPLETRNIAIISDADTMTQRAQNRLLKTLEEPFPGTILILLSENMENLTQTIQSRCVKYRLHDTGEESGSVMEETAKAVADLLLAQAPFYKRKSAIGELIKEEKETAAFLDALEKVYRDLLLGNEAKSKRYKKSDIYANIAFIEAARRQIQRGVSKRYAMKNLMIKIGG